MDWFTPHEFELKTLVEMLIAAVLFALIIIAKMLACLGDQLADILRALHGTAERH